MPGEWDVDVQDGNEKGEWVLDPDGYFQVGGACCLAPCPHCTVARPATITVTLNDLVECPFGADANPELLNGVPVTLVYGGVNIDGDCVWNAFHEVPGDVGGSFPDPVIYGYSIGVSDPNTYYLKVGALDIWGGGPFYAFWAVDQTINTAGDCRDLDSPLENELVVCAAANVAKNGTAIVVP